MFDVSILTEYFVPVVAAVCLIIGYIINGVDGIFGSGTKSAIIKYQNTKGLSADGIVGQNTWKKLLGL